MTLTREDFVTKSVNNYLRQKLELRGYGDDVFEMLDSYPHTGLDTPLEKSFIAVGFNFDDRGKPAEMGSTLTFRIYTIEFFIFGLNRTWAKNLANAVKFSLESDKIIPLLNITDSAFPVVDSLPVEGVSAEHQPIPEPKPWEENVWTVHLRIEDCYEAADAVA